MTSDFFGRVSFWSRRRLRRCLALICTHTIWHWHCRGIHRWDIFICTGRRNYRRVVCWFRRGSSSCRHVRRGGCCYGVWLVVRNGGTVGVIVIYVTIYRCRGGTTNSSGVDITPRVERRMVGCGSGVDRSRVATRTRGWGGLERSRDVSRGWYKRGSRGRYADGVRIGGWV